MKCFVWDWDDTLLDIRAYYRHSMNGDYIRHQMTQQELELDMPNYQYFVDLVYYLVEKGVRVGIGQLFNELTVLFVLSYGPYFRHEPK